MATETKNIIQLKESTNGPSFYPETHKAAVVGKETYAYLGSTSTQVDNVDVIQLTKYDGTAFYPFVEIGAVDGLTTTLSTIQGNISTAQGNITTLQGNVTTLQGYFDASGNAKTALKLTTSGPLSIWGVQYWNNGIPSAVTGRPNLYIGTTQVQTSSATQSITGIGTITFIAQSTKSTTGNVLEVVTESDGHGGTITYLHTTLPFISDGDQIVGSGTPGSGGGGTGTVPNLYELLDVDDNLVSPATGTIISWYNGQWIGSNFTSLENTDLLTYNSGTHRWTNVPRASVGVTTDATTSVHGLMSASDKQKLNSIAFGTQGTYTIPITIGSTIKDVYTSLPTAASNTLGVIKVGSTLSISSGVLDYNLPIATADALGGIKVGSGLSINSTTGVLTATYSYTLPLAANDTRGGIQIGYTQSGKNYPVQLSSEKAYVNVPWTDTTYKLTLNGTTNGDSTNGTNLGSFYAPTTLSGNTYVLIGGTSAPTWTLISGLSVGTAAKLGSSTLGSATKPIYLSSGTATECSTYAGGTAVTLNGTSKGATTASFYAPTGGGTANQVLIAGGNNTAPSWTNQSNLSVGTASKLGSTTVGSAHRPIYINNGTATQVSDVAMDYIGWADSTHAGLSSLENLYFTAGPNVFAFPKTQYIDVEYTNDGGTTWLDYGSSDSEKTALFTLHTNTITIGKKGSSGVTTNDGTRITVHLGVGTYCDCQVLLLRHYFPGIVNLKIEYTTYANTTTYVEHVSVNVSGNPEYRAIPFNKFLFGNNGVHDLRITFTYVGPSYPNLPHYLASIRAYARNIYSAPSTLGTTGKLYQIDSAKSAYFPGNIIPESNNSKNLGESSKRWSTIYGTALNLNGAITGATTGAFSDNVTIGGVLNITGKADFAEGIRLHGLNSGIGKLASVWFLANNATGYDAGMWGITVNSDGMRFRGPASTTATSVNDYVNILHGGNVGINNTNPTYKLTVGGTLGVTGLTTLTGGATIPATASLKIGDATITWEANNGNGYLYIDKPFVTAGDQIVGSGTPGGGGGGTGTIPYLTDLLDVIAGLTPTANKMLIWTTSGTNNAGTAGGWTLIDKSSVGITTLASASADGLMSSANWSKLDGIEANANNYSHPTGGANVTIGAANGKVLSAITVNNLGHVTSVSSKTLAEADIPNLSWSKITSGNDDLKAIENLTGTSGFLKKTAANTWTLDTSTYLTSHQTVTLASGTNNGTLKITTAAGTTDNIAVKGLQALAYKASIAFSDLSAHPTTISGYGITDAYTKTEVNTAISNAVTAALYFRGESSTAITNGGTETATIDGSAWTAHTGDVVLYNGLEFAWDGAKWIQFGDESSYVLKTTTVNGHALSGDVTVTKSDVGLGNVENTKLSTWAGTSNITTVGTITTGTWSASTIGVDKGGTGKTSWTQYGVLYASGTTTLAQVSNNTTATKKFLRMTGTGSAATAPAWDTLVASDIPNLDWSKITSGKPTTLSGYGITDAQALDDDLTKIAALSSSGYLKRSVSGSTVTWSLNTISLSNGTITIESGTITPVTSVAVGTGDNASKIGVTSGTSTTYFTVPFATDATNATNATTASKLSTVSKTIWGQTYWTSGGIPQNVTGRPNLYIGTTQVQTSSAAQAISGVTTLTASGLIKTTNYVQATRFYLTDDIYFSIETSGSGSSAVNYVKLNAPFLTVGDQIVGSGEPGGGGGGTGGAGYLFELNDVLSDTAHTAVKQVDGTTDAVAGNMFAFNGTKWYALKLGSNLSITSGTLNATNTTYSVFTASADGLAPMASSGNKTTAETAVGNYYLCADGKYRQLPANAFNDHTYTVNNGTFTLKTLVGSTTTSVSDFTANQSGTDDITFVQGTNITITPDATNRKITIAATDTTYGTGTAANVSGADTTAKVWTGAVLKSAIEAYGYVTTDNKVTQTATTTSAAYELLFSATADNTTRTEGARKTSTLTYNPSTKALSTGGAVNGLTLSAQTTGFKISGGTTSKTLTVGADYTLGAACAKGVTDNSSATAVTSSDTNLITGRTLYYAGYVKSSGVTKVSTGTGLTGGDITTTGTVSINSTYQTYISNGNTAYGWGNHASAGYLTTTDAADTYLTGTSNKNITVRATDSSNTWSAVGVGEGDNTKFNLKVIRFGQTPGATYGGNLSAYGSGLMFGGTDTRGFIVMRYASGHVEFGGGSFSTQDNTPTWHFGINGTNETTYDLATISSNASNGNTAYNSLGNYLPLAGGTMTGAITPAAAQAQTAWTSSSFTAYSTITGASKGTFGNAVKSALSDTNSYGSVLETWVNSSDIDYSLCLVNARNNATAGYGVGIKFKFSYGTDGTGKYLGLAAVASSSYANGRDFVFYNTTTETVRIASGGNVGIGVSNPTHKLHVDGTVGCGGITTTGKLLVSINANDVAEFKNSGTGIGVVTLGSNGTNGTRLVIKNAAGTDNAIVLNYNGDGTFGGSIATAGNVNLNNGSALQCKDSGGTLRLVAGVTAANTLLLGYGTATAEYDTCLDGNNIYLRYGASHTNGLVLNSSGNVGIGTDSPGEKLSVLATSGWTSSFVNNNAGVWLSYSGGDGMYIGSKSSADTAYLLRTYYGATTLGSTGTIALAVRADGKVGIGTASPAYPLDVDGQIQCGKSGYTGAIVIKRCLDGNAAYYIGSAGSSGNDRHTLQIKNDSASSTYLNIVNGTLTASGNLGVKTAPTRGALEVLGDACVRNTSAAILRLLSGGGNINNAKIFLGNTTDQNGFMIQSEFAAWAARQDLVFYRSNNTTSPYAFSAAEILRLTYDGHVKVTGDIQSTGDQTVTSDASLKTNFGAINYSVSDIAACRAVTFDWKDGHGHSAGSIAQDWKPLIPELVHGEDGNMTLAYGQIALVNTILIAKHEKEQDKEIDKQKEEIRKLKERVIYLEEQLKIRS